MEHESFEDEEVAKVLNEHFVSIKVDREERPDVDNIYMTVCQALTGHGGWPLTVFITPDKKPFYAGTYFPKNDRMGMPGLLTILERIINAWNNNRSALLRSGEEIANILTRPEDEEAVQIPEDIAHRAFSDFKHSFDTVFGGFGRAPKFPTPHNLYFLLRYWYLTKDQEALEMVEKTLDSMHRGGIFDHIGFGFCRYSTDRKWLVPHFEKMLYDNALLAIAYLEAYQATKMEKYACVARNIFTYILRDMTSPEGGFYSAEDADSEGEEGKFYVWSPDEIIQVLGKEDGEKFCRYYNITSYGNFEGKNIPNLIGTEIPPEDRDLIERCRKTLFTHREKRIHPYKDDKVLTAWNGLMIAAMAIGGRILGEEAYTDAAAKAVDFIFSKLVREDGRLLARYRDGESAYPAYVDDYAFLIWGLIELYETSYRPEYIEKALKLTDDLLRLFWDDENGGLFIYGSDSEQLIARPKEVYDGATPSGNSVSAMNFIRLSRLTGRADLEERADILFRTFSKDLAGVPRGHAYLLSAYLYANSPSKEVVMVSDADAPSVNEMLNVLNEDYRPFTSSLLYSDKHEELKNIAPFIADYKTVDGKATAYVCQNFTCSSPVTDIISFQELLSQ